MTIEEFKSTRFSKSQKARYKSQIYDISGVDFEEFLVGIDYGDETMWVRCENCEIIS